MKNYKCKYMNATQVAEIENLMTGEHKDTLMAFGTECMIFCREKDTRIAAVGLVVGALAGVAVSIGKKVYHKLKEKEEPKPWDKPGRDWQE